MHGPQYVWELLYIYRYTTRAHTHTLRRLLCCGQPGKIKRPMARPRSIQSIDEFEVVRAEGLAGGWLTFVWPHSSSERGHNRQGLEPSLSLYIYIYIHIQTTQYPIGHIGHTGISHRDTHQILLGLWLWLNNVRLFSGKYVLLYICISVLPPSGHNYIAKRLHQMCKLCEKRIFNYTLHTVR